MINYYLSSTDVMFRNDKVTAGDYVKIASDELYISMLFHQENRMCILREEYGGEKTRKKEGKE